MTNREEFRVFYDMGVDCYDQEEFFQARENFVKALEITETLIKEESSADIKTHRREREHGGADNDHPFEGNLSLQKVECMNLLGETAFNMGDFAEAEKHYRAVREEYRRMMESEPDCIQYRECMGMTLNNLGAALLGLERKKEADPCFREALKIYQDLYERFKEQIPPEERDPQQEEFYITFASAVMLNLGETSGTPCENSMTED